MMGRGKAALAPAPIARGLTRCNGASETARRMTWRAHGSQSAQEVDRLKPVIAAAATTLQSSRNQVPFLRKCDERFARFRTLAALGELLALQIHPSHDCF